MRVEAKLIPEALRGWRRLLAGVVSRVRAAAGMAPGKPRGAVFYRRPARLPRSCGAVGLISILAPLGTGCAALSQFNTFTPQQDVELGDRAYDEILASSKLITSGPDYQMVQRLTTRLVEATHFYHPELADLFQWEVQLIDDPGTVNAFCLPGGKMAVYTGILPVAQGETGLAVVMGHEIAHATDRHGTEALSRQLGVEVLIRAAMGEDQQALASAVAGLGHLTMGRRAELEADHDGLLLMAKAGYDPREATAFWERMSALGGDSPPEWLSTHPSHDTRIIELTEMMPEALEVYEESTRARP